MHISIPYLQFFRALILLFFVSGSCVLFGQSVTLNSQAKVDAFDPAKTVIDGNLLIGFPSGQNNDSDIHDLSNLANLTSITGKLTINRNPDLESLQGLHNLQFVNEFSFINNDKVKNLDDLESLETIQAHIFISGCSMLESISRLEFLQVVNGNLTVSSNSILESLDGLENIVEMNGSIRLSGLAIYTLDIFQELEEVDGLEIGSNKNLAEITGFSNLRHVHGGLNITSCGSSLTTMDSFNALESVGSGFRIYGCGDMLTLDGFSNLKSIGGGLTISFNYDLIEITGLENLSEIEGSITFSSNHDLQGIEFLHRINSINGNLRLSTNSDLKSFLPLSRVTSVTGSVELVQNYDVPNLDGLNRIEHIGEDLVIFNQRGITNLDQLSNLRTVGGDLNLYGNRKLTNIDGLNNINDFDGKIDISENHALYDVDGLKSFTKCEDLIINDNNNLLHINGIINLEKIQKNLQITRNDLLSDCCGYWMLDLNPNVEIGGNKNISNNGPSCEDVSVNKCGLGLIEGRVFYDWNMNQVQDSLEYGIPNIGILYNGNNQLNWSNLSGNYYLAAEKDSTYTIMPIIPDELELTTDLTQIELTYDPENIRYNDYNFGLVSPDPRSGGEVYIYVDEMRCNTEVECNVHVLNTGYNVENGILRLEFHDSLTVINDEILEVDSLGYFVSFDTLYPYEVLSLNLDLKTPSEQFTGEVVDIVASLYYYAEGDSLMLMDTAQYESVVLCSYDPNDKQVNPIGVKEENYTLIEDELLYTVRFQNTGNAPAIDVRILDTLDLNLDISTFNVVGSSHEMSTRTNGRAVEFLFEDIWLIDSLTNEEESQGYLQYTIRPFADVEELTEIENTAYIIFDFNPPIVTNTTKNTMVEMICEDQFIVESLAICEGEEFMGITEAGIYDFEYPLGITCDSFVTLELTVLPSDSPECLVNTNEAYSTDITVFPNPFQDRMVVSLSRGSLEAIVLYDLQGQLLGKWQGNVEYIDTRNLSSGVYILQAITDEGSSSLKKIVKR